MMHALTSNREILVKISILMKRRFILLFVVAYTLTVSATGQNRDTSFDITVTCRMPAVVRSNNDLLLNIAIKNNSSTHVSVYKELIEGDFNNILGNNLVNFKLIVQRRRSKKFEDYINRSSVDLSFAGDTTDVLSKADLGSKDSIVDLFHVDSRWQFEPGEYRIKCLYWNDTHNNKNIESNWAYFKVEHPIYIKHY